VTSSSRGSRRTRRIAAAAVLGAAVPGGLLTASAASAASGAAGALAATPCTVPALKSAITAANISGGTITLPSGCTITLAAQDNATNGPTGLPVITGKVTINGNGATIARKAATPSAPVPAFRLFNVATGGSLTLNGLTLRNGFADDGTNGGGAIFSLGTVHVSGVTFSGNQSPAATGTSGGAISSDNSGATLTVDRSTFTGNTAQEGGGIFTQSATSIANSTFTGNRATLFGGGALVSAVGTTRITGDTFSANSGPGGGAIDNDATVNITDSTFAGNTAGANGGGALQNFGRMTVTYSTLANNASPFGADMHNDPVAPASVTGPVYNPALRGRSLAALTQASTFSVTASIVSGGISGANCSGSTPFTDGGYNADSGTSCGFLATSHSKNNANLNLGPLAANGGPTRTMALPSGSPALNAIPPRTSGCAGPTDQRGMPRPQGAGCDIGAYERTVSGAIKGYKVKCVDNRGNSAVNGNKIEIWTCNGGAAQTWTYTTSGQLQTHGKCLDDANSGTRNGTKVQLLSCTGRTNQEWTWQASGEFVNKFNGLCLDDSGFSTTNGTQLEVWKCNNTANQHWTVPAG
jgi:Ricin-type beta-trefoil lectin domain/Chlamydia polymorphic membrane protein (Chlamydia_PMP) repeat